MGLLWESARNNKGLPEGKPLFCLVATQGP